MSANDRQVAGNHYGGGKLQHWDVVVKFNLDYFQGQVTKYLFRWRSKNGIEDLEKAKHFLEKYIEEAKAGNFSVGNAQNQDYFKFRDDRLLSQTFGYTVEGFVIRNDKPHQVYKCMSCGAEYVLEDAGQLATNQHQCPAGASPAYVNQGD